jgi:PAS domain S-box-containing protein
MGYWSLVTAGLNGLYLQLSTYNIIFRMHNNVTGSLSAAAKPGDQYFSFSVFDNVPVAIYTCDQDGYITAYNRAASEIWGRILEIGKERWMGTMNVFTVDGKLLSPENSTVARALREKKAIEGEEYIVKRPDGKQIRVNPNPVPVFDEDGELTGVVCTLNDVTETNEAELKQAILASIIDTSDDTIISKTLGGIITSWNASAERMFGYKADEVIGKHISILIPPERQSEESDIISKIAGGGKVDHYETIRVGKGGKQIPISLTVSPIVNKNGKVIGASKIARDISDRINTETNHARLAAIVNSSDDTIVSKTLKGIITSWNAAAERLFGYKAEEAVGKHISLIIPPERLNEEEYIIGEIAKGNKVDHFETFRVTKSGKLIPLSISVSPIVDSSGRVIGASKIARDITQQRKAQQDLLEYTAKLEEISTENARLYKEVKSLNEKKDEFIGLASHELKTPLTSIMGYLQILTRFTNNSEADKFVAKTLRQVRKLSTLVSDLLDVSKIEAGKLVLTKEKFDIKPVIDDAIELIQHTTQGHQIVLHTTITSLSIIGDPQRIEQVVINLLTNAIKYSPSGKQVDVFLTADKKQVKIGVKDEGIGIPADKLEQVFSRFYRVEELSSNISGLGIGLYLSKEIVDRHHGKIWVDSTLEKGSTFWITLPLEK